MFGSRLKKLREEKGLTQQQLAEKVNLSQQTIGHYEVGRAKPDLDTLQLLASKLNCSVDYLLGRTDIRNTATDVCSETPASYTEAAHQAGDPMDDLPEEAKRSLEEFKQYILEKYSKDKK